MLQLIVKIDKVVKTMLLNVALCLSSLQYYYLVYNTAEIIAKVRKNSLSSCRLLHVVFFKAVKKKQSQKIQTTTKHKICGVTTKKEREGGKKTDRGTTTISFKY